MVESRVGILNVNFGEGLQNEKEKDKPTTKILVNDLGNIILKFFK